MARRKRPDEGRGNQDRWLLTYADMITLLMILFLMLFTISQTDKAKYETLAASLSVVFKGGTGLQEGAGILPGSTALLPSPTPLVEPLPTPPSQSVNPSAADTSPAPPSATAAAAVPPDSNAKAQQITDAIRNDIALQKLGNDVTILAQTRGTVIRLNEKLLFASGSADLEPDAVDILTQIGRDIAAGTHYIRVEGHCDNRPIQTDRFPSNWELAAARAVNVAKILVDAGIDKTRISALSYGEFRPLAPNDSDANRRRNRRVEIVILYAEYASGETDTAETAAPASRP